MIWELETRIFESDQSELLSVVPTSYSYLDFFNDHLNAQIPERYRVQQCTRGWLLSESWVFRTLPRRPKTSVSSGQFFGLKEVSAFRLYGAGNYWKSGPAKYCSNFYPNGGLCLKTDNRVSFARIYSMVIPFPPKYQTNLSTTPCDWKRFCSEFALGPLIN